MGNQEPVEIVIEAGRTERHYWKDLWRYRELFYFLAWPRALQTDSNRNCLVVLRPFLIYGSVHPNLWEVCQASFR